MALKTFFASSLDDQQVSSWRAFHSLLPGGHYSHDPAWAEVESRLGAKRTCRPVFSWCENEGSLCFTAAGVRRESPIPGWGYYDFLRSPAFESIEYCATWVGQAAARLRSDALVLALSPYLRLDRGGDEVESMLKAHGFVRDSRLGTWGTMQTDLTAAEDALWASFPQRTRQGVRGGQKAGMEVRGEDDLAGWQAFSGLHGEMSMRSGVAPLSTSDLETMSRHWFGGGTRGTVLVARIAGRPVAACVVLVYRGVAYYLAAGSTRAVKGLSTSYLLAWEAIKWAQARGCRTLDWCGYNLTAEPGDPLWGTNLFKSAFSGGAAPVLYCAANERVLAPSRYALARLARRGNELVRRRLGERF